MNEWFVFPGAGPLFLTLQLAFVTTAILLVFGTPLAWWLAHTSSRLRYLIEPIVALPIVLPPTVVGFYMLVMLGPNGGLGGLWNDWFGHPLAFTFQGLVIASVLYSLPFVVQPLQNSFEAVGKPPMEAASMLGASPLQAFFRVAAPMSMPGFLTASVLGFAHTMGEFGVVLMVGGNIPGETRVISIAIYDHVEMMAYSQAHTMSAILLGMSFIVLTIVYSVNRRWRTSLL